MTIAYRLPHTEARKLAEYVASRDGLLTGHGPELAERLDTAAGLIQDAELAYGDPAYGDAVDAIVRAVLTADSTADAVLYAVAAVTA